MPHINELKDSKFLKKEDVGTGALVTIEKCIQENVAKEGAEPDMRWALHFKNVDKPMILNTTNGQLIAAITGHEHTDGWIGKQVVLYNEPTVTYAGRVTGGIRVRAPRGKAAAAAAAKPAPTPAPAIPQETLPQEEAEDDTVPF